MARKEPAALLPGVAAPDTGLLRRLAAWPSWELVICGLAGHALLGREVAAVRPQDDLVLREAGGVRWHRCLRCDTWVALPTPAEPTREHLPPRSEIDLPDRGKPLRDRMVLRTIALVRAVGFVAMVALGIFLLVLRSARADAQSRLYETVTNLVGGAAGSSDPEVQKQIDSVFSLSADDLERLGISFIVLGLLLAVEAVGLWRMSRWAYYFSFVVTAIQIPFEGLHIGHGGSSLKVVNLLIDLGVLVYLVVFKRLFGVRGGVRREREIRYADVGWPALEAATPPASAGPVPAA